MEKTAFPDIQPVAEADERESFPRLRPPWGIGAIIAILVIYFVLVFGLGIALVVWKAHTGIRIMASASIMVSLAGELLLMGLVMYAVLIVYHAPLKILGLSLPSWRELFHYGFLSGIAISILMPVAMSVLFSQLHLRPQPQTVVTLIMSVLQDRWLLAGCLLLAGLLAPVSEELFFRGFVYPAVSSRFGVAAAITITSCLFAAIHFDLLRFVFLALLGVLFALICEKTRSLLPAMVAHSIYNLTSIILMLLLSPKII